MDIDKYPYRIIEETNDDCKIIYRIEKARKWLFWTVWERYGTYKYAGQSTFEKAVKDLKNHIEFEKEPKKPAIVYIDFEGNNVQK